jgi:hypothetical protein
MFRLIRFVAHLIGPMWNLMRGRWYVLRDVPDWVLADINEMFRRRGEEIRRDDFMVSLFEEARQETMRRYRQEGIKCE